MNIEKIEALGIWGLEFVVRCFFAGLPFGRLRVTRGEQAQVTENTKAGNVSPLEFGAWDLLFGAWDFHYSCSSMKNKPSFNRPSTS